MPVVQAGVAAIDMQDMVHLATDTHRALRACGQRLGCAQCVVHVGAAFYAAREVMATCAMLITSEALPRTTAGMPCCNSSSSA